MGDISIKTPESYKYKRGVIIDMRVGNLKHPNATYDCRVSSASVLLIIFSIVFSTGSFNEILAAQTESWKPSKPMKIILSGRGAYDLIARQLARGASRLFGTKSHCPGRGRCSRIQRHGCAPWIKPGWSYNKSTRCGHVRWIGNNQNLYSWNVRDIPVIMALDAPPYGIFSSPKSPYKSYQDIVKTKTPSTYRVGRSNFYRYPSDRGF